MSHCADAEGMAHIYRTARCMRDGAKACAGRQVSRIAVLRLITPLAWCIAGVLHAQSAPGYTQNDFGEIGLLQTPTARMSDPGEVSFVYSRVQPYTYLNASAQPFSWLEATARYVIVSDRVYFSDPSQNKQRYKDKSIDAKIRLRGETHYLPALAVGIRDLAGTGLFSSEYFVASKRAGPFDFSLGLAWGNLGARGDLPNPFGWIFPGFNNRPQGAGGPNGNGTGNFSVNRYFHGPTALFGGVEYQTPWERLRLKLELDGNNYQHEGLNNNQVQRWPVNLGAMFRVNHYVDLSLGYERGNTAMVSLSIHDNLAQHTEAAKPLDPPPEPAGREAVVDPVNPVPHVSPATIDWAAVSKILEDNAGIKVTHIAQRGSELLVYGQQKRFFYASEGLGRAARLLDNRLDSSIDWITVVSENHGLAVVESSVHRQRFIDLLNHDIEMPTFRRSVEQDPTAPQQEQVLYTAPLKKLDLGLSPGYAQSLGGVNAPVLYQVTADGTATYHFNRNLWWDGEVDVMLLNNYQNYTFDAPSQLPRVRTDVRKYLESSNVTMPNFQLTGTRQFGTDLYGMAYAGMLESMFGGVGGEMLYRPFGDHWAVGADANWVQQRGFKQDFSFRHYRVLTGQATLYLDTGFEGLHAALSAGRYLARDWGTTLEVSRYFDNGVRMGAYATFTTAGKAYGEGSFDKGVYLSVPIDLFAPFSRNRSASLHWQPLLRDGGARLKKAYYLYEMTDDRDTDLFDQNLDKITN